jgi:hypothetical protein
MIRLLFTHEREIIIFEIENKTITYRDRKWEKGVRFIPRDEDFMKKVIFSMNKISYKMIDWINEANSGKNFEEWKNCNDDEAVAEIVIRDARSRGCVLKNKSYGEQQQEQQEPTK